MSSSDSEIGSYDDNSIEYNSYSKIENYMDEVVFDNRRTIHDDIEHCDENVVNDFMRTYRYLMDSVDIEQFMERIGTYTNAKIFLVMITTGLEEYINEMSYMDILMLVSMYVRDVYGIDWDKKNNLEKSNMIKKVSSEEKKDPGDIKFPEDEEDLEVDEIINFMDFSISEGYNYDGHSDVEDSDDESEEESDKEVESNPEYSLTVEIKGEKQESKYVWVENLYYLTCRMEECGISDDERNYVVDLLEGQKSVTDLISDIDKDLLSNALYFFSTSRPSSKATVSLYDTLYAVTEAVKWLTKTDIDKENILSNDDIKSELSNM